MSYELEIIKSDRGRLVQELENAGTQFRGNTCVCPFCDDRNPSGSIYRNDKGHWKFKCHKCDLNMSIVDVLVRRQGIGTPDAIKLLVGDSSTIEEHSSKRTPLPEINGRIFPTIEAMVKACPQPVVAAYHYTNPDSLDVDMIVIRSQMPDGKKTFRQGRPCPNGFELKAPPQPWPIYNRTRIKEADTVVVCEGEQDVHSLARFGITATTSPAGAGKAHCANWEPLAGKNCILWPDNDDVGRKHMQQVRDILDRLNPPARVSTIDEGKLNLPNKGDATDFIKRLESDEMDVGGKLQEVLQIARPRSASDGVSSRIDDIIAGKFEAVKWPWPMLSSISNALLPGTVTLLCGSPGASKSFMLLEALAHWMDTDIRGCVFELEEDKDYHLLRALAQRSGLSGMTSPDWIRKNQQEVRKAFEQHNSFLDELARHLTETPDAQPTLEQIARWTGQQAKAGYRLICIDPITAAAQTNKPWIEDNAFLQSIKRIAVAYGTSIVLVTHPKQSFERPDMNALAGGSAYSRFAQTILWLENHSEPKINKLRMSYDTIEQEYNRTLHILKARNGTGQCRLACNFDPETLCLKELGIIVKN